jgi:hypothetical protein
VLQQPVAANAYVHLGCVADILDGSDVSVYGVSSKQPALESFLQKGYDRVDPPTCASAAKRAGKRFFGLRYEACRAGSSLISALRHSARPGTCGNQCALDVPCFEVGNGSPPSLSLYALKTGKGESLTDCA